MTVMTPPTPTSRREQGAVGRKQLRQLQGLHCLCDSSCLCLRGISDVGFYSILWEVSSPIFPPGIPGKPSAKITVAKITPKINENKTLKMRIE